MPDGKNISSRKSFTLDDVKAQLCSSVTEEEATLVQVYVLLRNCHFASRGGYPPEKYGVSRGDAYYLDVITQRLDLDWHPTWTQFQASFLDSRETFLIASDLGKAVDAAKFMYDLDDFFKIWKPEWERDEETVSNTKAQQHGQMPSPQQKTKNLGPDQHQMVDEDEAQTDPASENRPSANELNRKRSPSPNLKKSRREDSGIEGSAHGVSGQLGFRREDSEPVFKGVTTSTYYDHADHGRVPTSAGQRTQEPPRSSSSASMATSCKTELKEEQFPQFKIEEETNEKLKKLEDQNQEMKDQLKKMEKQQEEKLKEITNLLNLVLQQQEQMLHSKQTDFLSPRKNFEDSGLFEEEPNEEKANPFPGNA